jgi:predicted Mrr-cat superfamily restriction endonuclease
VNPSVHSVPQPVISSPRIWLVRAGRGGKYIDLFRSRSIVALPIEFNSHASLATAASLVAAGYSPGNAPGVAALLRRFALDLEVKEFVISPVSGQQRHLVGMVASDYRFVPTADYSELHHVRDVSWQAEVPASEFSVQLRRTLGSPLALYLPAAQGELTSFLHEQGLLSGATDDLHPPH